MKYLGVFLLDFRLRDYKYYPNRRYRKARFRKKATRLYYRLYGFVGPAGIFVKR